MPIPQETTAGPDLTMGIEVRGRKGPVLETRVSPDGVNLRVDFRFSDSDWLILSISNEVLERIRQAQQDLLDAGGVEP